MTSDWSVYVYFFRSSELGLQNYSVGIVQIRIGMATGKKCLFIVFIVFLISENTRIIKTLSKDISTALETNIF